MNKALTYIGEESIDAKCSACIICIGCFGCLSCMACIIPIAGQAATGLAATVASS